MVENEMFIVEAPEFQFNGFKVRVLSSMPNVVYLCLCKLQHIFEASNEVSNPVELFVQFVSFDLFYPVQVLPTLPERKEF